ncbi:MAG: hypothetical protein LBS34_00275 [Rickettsiales bacterium]|jgi:hypothetical protein|nr:hypothetical protein [Rickettsiales bacterium]
MRTNDYIDLQNLRGRFRDFDICCKLTADGRIDLYLDEEYKKLIGAGWIRCNNIKNIEYVKGVFNLLEDNFYFYAEKDKNNGLFTINRDRNKKYREV